MWIDHVRAVHSDERITWMVFSHGPKSKGKGGPLLSFRNTGGGVNSTSTLVSRSVCTPAAPAEEFAAKIVRKAPSRLVAAHALCSRDAR